MNSLAGPVTEQTIFLAVKGHLPLRGANCEVTIEDIGISIRRMVGNVITTLLPFRLTDLSSNY